MGPQAGREIEIFTEAVQLSVEERVAFLDRSCAGNEQLRRKIEALLKSNDRAGAFLEQPPTAIEGGRAKAFNVGEKAGDTIGRYKLLQQLGEGGCGIVFMAQQEEPVHRRVALKVVKPGMDTNTVIARFEAERQALALMDHPNIAQVFDAGATESGRPYFAMELVKGINITDYCDHHSLSITARLKLFCQVCNAIQHAHQKGIIHRDIKPSNVLVSSDLDDKPVPKIIDFGIAKAIAGQQLTDKTSYTAHEMLIGTPAYMSPEQAAIATVDVDTRSDIYSLGVLLYELLTGTTPFDTQELLKAGLDEVRRVIRDREPVRPSIRVSTTVVGESTKVSKHRGTEVAKLTRELGGDLDWIVMKALEKDPVRRYATANGFAMDVGRYLSGEAILARPPSTSYKLRKLFLRNRPLCIGVTAIFVSLLIALMVMTRLAVTQRRALKLAAALQLETKANGYVREKKLVEAEAALRESLAIRRQYLAGEPPTAESLELVLASMLERNKLSETVDLLDEIVTPVVFARPECRELITMRAELCARKGRWQAAASDAAFLARQQPNNHYRYHMLAPLLVATTNIGDYQNLCSKILVAFSNTTDFVVADRMAKDCLILPSAGVDLRIVAAMAKMAVTKGKRHGAYPLFQCCDALAQYRLGNWQEAATGAQQAAKYPFPYSQADAYAILAMAQFKTGKETDAWQALSNCVDVVENKLPAPGRDLDQDWRDWIIAHALQEEADNLVHHRPRAIPTNP